MSDFVAYEPSARSVTSEASVRIRAAKPVDVHGLAAVMSSRGGTVEDHLDAAGRLIERLPVLLMAEKDGGAVGWCGIQKHLILPDAEPEWLVAGLTVVPDQRRRGIVSRLLRVTAEAAHGEPVFSVINARNPASIDLHTGLGLLERRPSPESISRAARGFCFDVPDPGWSDGPMCRNAVEFRFAL